MSASDPDREGIRQPGTPWQNAAPRRRASAPEIGNVPVPAGERLTTFFGRTLVERRPWPWAGWFYLLLAMTFAAFSFAYKSLALFVGGTLGAGTCALVYLLVRPRSLSVTFTSEGIETAPGIGFLPYHRIHEVFAPQRADGRADRFPIHLLYDEGYVTLPARLSDSSRELYDFLASQPLGARALPPLDALFQDFLRQQTALHGAGPIYVYHARAADPLTDWRRNAWRKLALALGLTALVWLPFAVLAGQMRAAAPLAFVGGLVGVAFFAAVFFFLVSLAAGRGRTRVPPALRRSTLIVAPAGLALVQGPLQGELRWAELRRLTKGSGSFALSRRDAIGPGLHLQVEGAVIHIADIYHWPLAHIEQVIREYAGL